MSTEEVVRSNVFSGRLRLAEHVESLQSLERSVPLGISERRIILMFMDLLAVNLSVAAFIWMRSSPTQSIGLANIALWFGVPSLFWLAWAHTFDLYDLSKWMPFDSLIASLSKTSILTYLGFLLVPYVMPSLPERRLHLATPFLIMLGTTIAFRLTYLKVLDKPRFARTVLIFGAGWAGRTIAELLHQSGNHAFRVIGFLDDDPEKIGKFVSVRTRSGQTRLPVTLPVLGDRHALMRLLDTGAVDGVILAITHDVDGELLQLLMDGLEKGVEIIPMPVLYEHLTGRVPIEHVGENWYVAMPVDAFRTTAWRVVKRTIDIALASLGMLVMLPVFPLICLAIYIDSPGPIFYSQLRVGKRGRIFRIYKFRSMVPDAENGRAVWAQRNDKRVTRVGRILRKAHIDEFPQFWNILKGDMSAVGPRPERPEFVEELAREIPFYRVRHAVKPGMAGWALVKHGYAASKEDAIAKLQYDLYYVKHQSIWLDIEILLKTLLDTVSLRGRA